ncbi:MAG: ribose 5-phosphate isomerase B [Myxococcales bacterium]|nr:ribose 5-phosphate isomerase B [Myxococcales bacterium]
MTERAGRVGIGCDHAAVELKRALMPLIEELGGSLRDFGTDGPESCDYPDFAHAVAEAITAGQLDRGVLICGTGLGMSYAANRHAGVRAALCTDGFTARMARAHNDANVLCLGARVVGIGVAEDIVRAFFTTDFDGGRHARRVAKIEPGDKP